MTGAEILDLLTVKKSNAKRWGEGGVQLFHNPATLTPEQLSFARNCFMYKGALRTWPGHAIKGTGVAGESIMGLHVHFHDDGARHTHRFGFSNMQTWESGAIPPDWTIVWEEYRDTAANDVSVAGTAVTSAALAKWNTRSTAMGTKIYPGDQFIMVADITGSPADPWKTIATVNSDVSITLTGAYTGGTPGPGIARFRKKFHGTINQYPSIAEMNGTIFVTYPNSQDYIKYLDNTLGILRSLTDGTTPNNVPAAKGLLAFADRLFAWGIVPATYSRVAATVRTLAWSSNVSLADWTGGGSGAREFSDLKGSIKVCKRLDQNIVLFGDFGIYQGQRVGTADPPVSWQPQITSPEKGLLAEGGVVEVGGNKLIYPGQDDFYTLTTFSSETLGNRAIRDYFYGAVNADQLSRIRGESFDEYNVAIWLYCEQESLATHAFAYDYFRDVFYGPFQLGASAVMVPGHFVAGGGSGPTIDQLVGTIDAQTWILGVPFGIAGQQRVPMFGGASGDTYIVDDSDTFNGSIRGPEMRSATFHLREPGSSAGVTRVTIVHRRPKANTVITVAISDDDFGSVIQTEEVTLAGGSDGATVKTNIDFLVDLERVGISLKALSAPSAIEVFELYAEHVGLGQEF